MTRAIILTAVGVALFAAFVCAVLWLPAAMIPAQLHGVTRAKAVSDERANVLQAFAGLALIGAGVFTWIRIDIARKQLRATEEQQITERFSRAIDQLGEQDHEGRSRLDVRIGGVYSLERVAHDSMRRSSAGDPSTDHVTVVQVLSAFVRTHIPEGSRRAGPPWEPTPDVSAALGALGRIGLPAPLGRIDASRAAISGVQLPGARLIQANLSGAILSFSSLSRAELIGADLSDADLSWADLSHAALALTNLCRADLLGTNLRGADLSGADLSDADVSHADFAGVLADENTKWPDDFDIGTLSPR